MIVLSAQNYFLVFFSNSMKLSHAVNVLSVIGRLSIVYWSFLKEVFIWKVHLFIFLNCIQARVLLYHWIWLLIKSSLSSSQLILVSCFEIRHLSNEHSFLLLTHLVHYNRLLKDIFRWNRLDWWWGIWLLIL